MILIVGGAFQGKKAYAKEKFSLREKDFTDGGSCGWEEIFSAGAVLHFHAYIRRCLEEGRGVSERAKELAGRNPDVVVIADELGCGVVPADAFDREYREQAGRVCCALAKEAREVHRVICGIGMVIKHD